MIYVWVRTSIVLYKYGQTQLQWTLLDHTGFLDLAIIL